MKDLGLDCVFCGGRVIVRIRAPCQGYDKFILLFVEWGERSSSRLLADSISVLIYLRGNYRVCQDVTNKVIANSWNVSVFFRTLSACRRRFGWTDRRIGLCVAASDPTPNLPNLLYKSADLFALFQRKPTQKTFFENARFLELAPEQLVFDGRLKWTYISIENVFFIIFFLFGICSNISQNSYAVNKMFK